MRCLQFSKILILIASVAGLAIKEAHTSESASFHVQTDWYEMELKDGVRVTLDPQPGQSANEAFEKHVDRFKKDRQPLVERLSKAVDNILNQARKDKKFSLRKISTNAGAHHQSFEFKSKESLFFLKLWFTFSAAPPKKSFDRLKQDLKTAFVKEGLVLQRAQSDQASP